MRRKLTAIKPPLGNRFAGFTLTEVITASALLVIAMVPILKSLTTAHLNTSFIERKTRSLVLAQARLDEIKTRSVYYYSDSFSESDLSLDGLYLCDVADTPAGPNIRKITISVGYDLNENNAIATDEILVTLVTLIAKRW